MTRDMRAQLAGDVIRKTISRYSLLAGFQLVNCIFILQKRKLRPWNLFLKDRLQTAVDFHTIFNFYEALRSMVLTVNYKKYIISLNNIV